MAREALEGLVQLELMELTGALEARAVRAGQVVLVEQELMAALEEPVR